MQLITILLVTVAILTFLSGVTVFFGSTKGYKVRSFWFFLAALFATIWMISISLFIQSEPSWGSFAEFNVRIIFICALFLDTAFLGYVSWHTKYGKVLTYMFSVFAVTIGGLIVFCPEYLYSSINLTPAGNTVEMRLGLLYYSYMAFFAAIVPAVVLSLFFKNRGSKAKKKKAGDIVVMITFGLSSVITLVADLLLPLFGNWSAVWMGPLALSVTIIAFYYSILRYRSLNLESIWLKIFSYTVIAASLAIIYMVIFSMIFAGLFRGATPSTEVIILNFTMILIVILLMPATNELSMFVRSLISNRQIDMVYVVRKISKTTSKDLNLKSMASFLAEHMHFEYVGFLIDNQIYGSSSRHFSADAVKMVSKLGKPEKNIWQKVNEESDVWKEAGLSAVAALCDANGNVYGQLMLGKPVGKVSFSKRDITQIETIINLVAVVAGNKAQKKA